MYAKKFIKLDYIEEDQSEKDSWQKVSEVANVEKGSGRLKNFKCIKPPNLNHVKDVKAKFFSSVNNPSPEDKRLNRGKDSDHSLSSNESK